MSRSSSLEVLGPVLLAPARRDGVINEAVKQRRRLKESAAALVSLGPNVREGATNRDMNGILSTNLDCSHQLVHIFRASGWDPLICFMPSNAFVPLFIPPSCSTTPIRFLNSPYAWLLGPWPNLPDFSRTESARSVRPSRIWSAVREAAGTLKYLDWFSNTYHYQHVHPGMLGLEGGLFCTEESLLQ